MDPFPRSSREEDDEESLEAQGQAKEVDIRSLGLEQLKNLSRKVVKNTEEDNENCLLRLKKRFDR
jgi:hypothetical protein